MNHVLVLHDLDGPQGSAVAFAAHLEAQGFAVSVPDIFPAAPPEGADEAALTDWATTLSDADILERARGAFQEKAQNEARVAVCGLGWGGAYALLLGAHEPRVLATADIAGAITYAAWTAKRPGSPLNFVAGLNGPFFAAFPANDPNFSGDEIERLRGRLVEHDKAGEVKVYEAGPHFWREDSEATHALQTRLAAFLRNAFNPAPPSPMPQHIRPETGYPNEASRIHA
jgi:dienelactone hydrolase